MANMCLNDDLTEEWVKFLVSNANSKTCTFAHNWSMSCRYQIRLYSDLFINRLDV